VQHYKLTATRAASHELLIWAETANGAAFLIGSHNVTGCLTRHQQAAFLSTMASRLLSNVVMLRRMNCSCTVFTGALHCYQESVLQTGPHARASDLT